MKHLVLLLIIAAALTGCRAQPKVTHDRDNDAFAIIEFDSCEYIMRCEGYAGYLAHKGNCKYCAERNKKNREIK